jgi:hypothetical protein
MTQDASSRVDQVIKIFRAAAALTQAGKHADAAIQLRKCLAILEPLAAETGDNTSHQTNLMLVLHALADSLRTLGRHEESDAFRKRGFDILFRLDDAHRAATRFSFANRKIDISLMGEGLDCRRLLRNLESLVRTETGIAQIAIDFGDEDLPEGKLSYDKERGYRILLSPFEVLDHAIEETEARMVGAVRAHSGQHNVGSTPPPIAHTSVTVHSKLEVDTQRNRYDALAHDGGYVLAFYRPKPDGAGTLLRHVPPIGFVHYRFASRNDYDELRRDAAAHCSAFLDVGYLADEDMSEDTLRAFLRENRLYGWGLSAGSNAPVSKADPFRIAGKELREGQVLSEQEAEELIQNILSDTRGPIILRAQDAASDVSVRSRVENWSDFTTGPRRNKEARERQVSELQAKGYLSLQTGKAAELEYRTAYKALTGQYFGDFNEFHRHQEIPPGYLQPASIGNTVFISHRWKAAQHPDPNGDQFRILRHFVQQYEVRSIWYDFSCVPQPPRTGSDVTLFRDSVRDLNTLVMGSDFLSIETEDYMTRAWCYYEWIVSHLFSCGRSIRIRAENVETDYYRLVTKLVLEGERPHLTATLNEDMPQIDQLLFAGVEMFKTLALSVTLSVLNKFGFSFGVGIASRFAKEINFTEFWTIWQVLAASSDHSGITLTHLLNQDRLEHILRDRHERLGTHGRMHRELSRLSNLALDLRLVEQDSQNHLLEILAKVRRLGAVPAAYTSLALLTLVYSFAADRVH